MEDPVRHANHRFRSRVGVACAADGVRVGVKLLTEKKFI